MADDYGMDEEAEGAGPSQAPETPEKPEAKDDSDSNQGLLSNEFFGGKVPEPGETCEIEVVHAYDGEVSVRYKGKKDGSSEAPKEDDMAMDTGGDY